RLPGLPREKVLAAVVGLLERTFIRIGNEEYARENKSFGLTTMKDRHVKVKGPRLRFRFRGKSGRQHEVDITDRRIAKIVSKCQDLSGQDLFQYVSDEGEVRDITSQDVNDYLGEITNENFTAKDFRTWAGTVLTAIALNVQGEFETKKQAKANVKTAICAAAHLLGNTPAICRKCYVHPAIVEAYLSGRQVRGLTEAIGTPVNVNLRAVDGEGASDAEPSVFGGFLFAAPVLLWRARGVGVGDAAVTAGFVVAVVPCCWQEETIDAMPIRAVIKHSVYLFIGLVSVRLPQ